MKSFIAWLLAATITTIAFVTIYATVQQSLRQGANSPQIQIAEDTAQLFNKEGAEQALPNGRVNLANSSLAPFVIIYDRDGKRLAGNVEYDDGSRHHEVVDPPSNVFGQTKDSATEDRITWQDKYGTRIAAVIVRSDNGYVLAGRSLREVESVENKVFKLSLAGWLVSMLVLGLGFMTQTAWSRRARR